MDDQHGNLIDGTARARQWRRSRPKSRAASDSTEQRSDAPKNMAASLLVPAEMLVVTTSSPTSPDVGDGGADGTGSEARGSRRSEAPVRAEGRHVNPFLTQERVEPDVTRRSRGTRYRALMASIRRRREQIDGAPHALGSYQRPPLVALRWQLGRWPIQVAGCVLGAGVALAVVLAVFGQSRRPGDIASQARDENVSTDAIASVKPDSLAAFANPFDAKGVVHHQRVRVNRSRRAGRKFSASRHRVVPGPRRGRATITHPVVAAHYESAPSARVHVYLAPDVQRSAAATSTSTGSASPPAQHYSNGGAADSHTPPPGPTGPGALLGPGHC